MKPANVTHVHLIFFIEDFLPCVSYVPFLFLNTIENIILTVPTLCKLTMNKMVPERNLFIVYMVDEKKKKKREGENLYI